MQGHRMDWKAKMRNRSLEIRSGADKHGTRAGVRKRKMRWVKKCLELYSLKKCFLNRNHNAMSSRFFEETLLSWRQCGYSTNGFYLSDVCSRRKQDEEHFLPAGKQVLHG